MQKGINIQKFTIKLGPKIKAKSGEVFLVLKILAQNWSKMGFSYFLSN